MTTIVAPPWEEQPTGGGIADAPTDGKTYGRKDAAWAELVSTATAGDIVAASALPLPDVWAPLSDSLRLITGYGREVKVGEDVVSQMVNFSRSTTATYIGKDGQLKTAAVNEPRFEKEGLLIEGQSTNLVVRSEVSPWIVLADAYTISPSAVRGYNLHSCVYSAGIDDALVVDTGAALQAPDGTASFVFNSATVVGSWVCYFNETDGYSSFWPKNSSVFAYADLGNGLIRVSRKLKGTTLNTIHFRCGRVVGSRIDIGCYQIEALPFASSYIPTNGAAVTRAMDKTLMPVKMNEATKVQTCAIEINIPLVNISTYRWILQGSYVSLSITNAGQIRGWDFAAAVGAGLTREGQSVIAQRITDASRSVFNNGVGFTVSNTDNLGVYFPYSTSDLAIGWHMHIAYALYGHVRNLRIWHRDLGDTQIKAIA